MTHEAFERVLQEQLSLCTDILCRKSKEYSSQEDKLHNFKNAAGLQGVTQIQALSGMMAKHTISIYDMCMSGKSYPIPHWEEKITDSINYLLLLKGIIVEESNKPETVIPITPTPNRPTQAELEDLFTEPSLTENSHDNNANVSEPVKGKYEGLSDDDLLERICHRGFSKCEDCPLFTLSGGWDTAGAPCNEFPTFRKIAIEYLEGLDKRN